MSKWIVIEGGEGTGKSSLVNSLSKHLIDKGLKVLVTKEPGTPHCPVTMQLRNIMLNADFDAEMTVAGRELISQAIRSIHVEWVRKVRDQYDVIIQDRGILSGFAYGSQTGNSEMFLEQMARAVTGSRKSLPHIVGETYDYTLFLACDPKIGLARASRAKQEFAAGDAMEMKGLEFHYGVRDNFEDMMYRAIEYSGGTNGSTIDVENMTKEEVLIEAIKRVNKILKLK